MRAAFFVTLCLARRMFAPTAGGKWGWAGVTPVQSTERGNRAALLGRERC